MAETVASGGEPQCTLTSDEQGVVFSLGRDRLARYVSGAAPRPFLADLRGPGGRVVTRPLDLAGLPADSRDHPHQRGVWAGHRDVGGADLWTDFDGHGVIAARGRPHVLTEPGRATACQELDWIGAAGELLLTETRLVRAYPELGDGSRIIDLELRLAALPGRPVTLGDTKEAGLAAVRVAVPMEERRGGRVENAAGVVGADRCWGQPASWCDYSGPVSEGPDGGAPDGARAGIAILDHPGNPRHPVSWHVRDYGLMAANPFGYRDFFPGQHRDGSLELVPGAPVSFCYRIVVHAGDARVGRVAERYAEFAATARPGEQAGQQAGSGNAPGDL
ncbi:MAG TPA: PmoA family protein [Streptosporangiaceae bacterium]|nr:PmoA family protein [Streptosporangiaceae bacterium]